MTFKKGVQPRVMKFHYEPTVADPAFQVGAEEYLDDPAPVRYARSWRTRLASWLVDMILPKKLR